MEQATEFADRRKEQAVGHRPDASKPTERQLEYIGILSRSVGLKFDVSKIQTGQQASQLIERLKQLDGQMNGKSRSVENELRDKRVVFGMATKLVFKKYMDSHRDYRKSKSFWREVESFFQEYQLRQESAVRALSSSPSRVLQMDEALHGALFPNGGATHYKIEKQENEIKNGGGKNGAA